VISTEDLYRFGLRGSLRVVKIYGGRQCGVVAARWKGCGVLVGVMKGKHDRFVRAWKSSKSSRGRADSSNVRVKKSVLGVAKHHMSVSIVYLGGAVTLRVVKAGCDCFTGKNT